MSLRAPVRAPAPRLPRASGLPEPDTDGVTPTRYLDACTTLTSTLADFSGHTVTGADTDRAADSLADTSAPDTDSHTDPAPTTRNTTSRYRNRTRDLATSHR